MSAYWYIYTFNIFVLVGHSGALTDLLMSTLPYLMKIMKAMDTVTCNLDHVQHACGPVSVHSVVGGAP